MVFASEEYLPVLNLNLLPALGLESKCQPFLNALVEYERAADGSTGKFRAEADLCALARQCGGGTGIVIQRGQDCYWVGPKKQKSGTIREAVETIPVLREGNPLPIVQMVSKPFRSHPFSRYLFQGESPERVDQYLRLVYIDLISS